MKRSAHCPLLPVLLLGVLLATLVGGPGAAAAGQIAFDADASATALGIPTVDPAVYAETLSGFGSARTLGHFRLDGTHEANVVTNTIANGLLTLTFSGGDTLAGTYSGLAFATADPAKFVMQGEVIFTGGTGRFARAKGRGPFNGQLEIKSISQDGVIREAVTLEFDGRLNL